VGLVTTNLVVGPATLYYGVFGTTEPAYSAIASTPGAGWTDVGMTADGTAILLEIDQTITDFGAEQLIDDIAGRVTKRVIQITATLLEATLQNMQLALNGLATITGGVGYSVLDPITASAASQPNYTAFILDGWAPTTGTTETACRRRVAVRKCLSSSKVDLEYEKTKPATYMTTWKGYYVSPSVAPYEVTDQTS
jgi:hypothetical protein